MAELRGMSLENFKELNREIQPTIPKGFPKERMPKELCQHALLNLLQCTMRQDENFCGHQSLHYYHCRNERDSSLFSAIKTWEIGTFNDINKQEKQYEYISDLQKEEQELQQRLVKLPNTIVNNHKRWRVQSDIEQLNWRIGYLQKSLSQ